MHFWLHFRPRLLLTALCVLALVPVPAIADAHPGLHWNPHPSDAVLLAIITFLVIALIPMWAYLGYLKRKETLAKDRLIRARLNLAASHDQLIHWRGQRSHWRARRYLAPPDVRAAIALAKRLDRSDN